MQNKQITLAGLFVGAGIVIAGVFAYCGILGAKSFDRSVTVKGLSEIEVPADRVIWPIMYSEAGNDLLQIYNVVEAKNRTIVNFLKSNGIAEEEITFAAPSVEDLNRYSNDRPFRYTITSAITVTSEQVDLVRKLMTGQNELLKKGIAISGDDYRYQTQFLFTKLSEVKPQMIQEATKNARATAEKFAEDSGSELGKIRTAAQGQLSIESRDANTPYIKQLRVVTTVVYQLKD